MPYQTVWVEPEVLYRGERVIVLAAYDEDEAEIPMFYWVRPIPSGYDLAAEQDFEAVDLRDLGFTGDYVDDTPRQRFIEQAVTQGVLQVRMKWNNADE